MDITTDLYIEDGRLYQYAVSTAKLLRPIGTAGGRRAAEELRRSREQIRRTTEAIRRRYEQQERVPAACEWLLDNWYLAQREYLVAAGALRQAKHLRQTSEGLLILGLARGLVRAGQGSVTEARCRSFLDGFQSVTVLRRAELELFPAAVRAAALEELAAVCRRLSYAADLNAYTAPLEALFTTLRLFAVLDTEKLLAAADVTDAILAADPSGDYPRMDRETRRDYLRRIELLARRAGMEEHSYARSLLKTARAENRHVGCYLFQSPGEGGAALYIAANLLLTVSLSLLGVFAFRSALAAVLLLLPVSELVKGLTDFVLSHAVRPRRMPRMDMEKGVPAEGKTLCVVSALLTDEESAAAQARRLEELRLACRSEGPNLRFGLLADLPASPTEVSPEDEAILRAAEIQINRLNRRYRGGFYLFTRSRSFDGEGWTGAERKRGAITALARLLCDRPSALRVVGDRDGLAGTRYLLTLDSDTQLYPGAAGELIGAMLHPLCRPLIDEKRRVVTRGHAVLQPRMATDLQSANATDFALIFAGAGGSDPYGGLCGELYMDAFGSSGFAGKGLLDLRAYLACTEDRLSGSRVLSHDALEGACLRGGFVGDTEFFDAFPARPLSWYKRLHRWVRGDWQNLPFVFCRDFAPLDRWRLFDNLRRSLLSPMTLAAILAGFFLPGPGPALSAWAALLALLSRLLLALTQGSTRPREVLRLRRYTRLLTGVGGAIVQTFLRLWLLPWEAWVCLSAILTALWRMLVSHRRLLQWQTAAQSEQGGSGLPAHLKAMWQSVLLGLLLLVFSPVIIGRSAGLLWLLSPLMAAALALPAFKENELTEADRDYLRAAAEQSYRYFTAFCTEEDHFLPPDNFQEQPPTGLAHRTSPTNIGLFLAAAVAAADLELISPKAAAERIGRTVSTLEQLPRHLGHYYNWYDTRTLRPLQPAYLSTVDSGNLCAALTAVRGALTEWGETALARRAAALLAPMSFSPLYDKSRNLFYICYDTAEGRGAGGWYDLMASEAMLTSYLAVARGDVPKKHWRRLSRAQLQKDGYRGLASWTGTMFEYLMPELFLPLYRASLLFETGRFCLYVQKRRVFAGKPWGISESAFYALDNQRSYRYKANGCGALALKRGQDEDMVVSPYSSFLALAVDPAGAVKNLRRLERFGAVGRYGYMEALDFSPRRCRRDSGEKVRCYMAHHVGMSVIAAANALCGGSLRRRFLADPAMAAYRLLLQERLPEDAAVLRRDLSEVPEKPRLAYVERWSLRGDGAERREHWCLLSNGSYHLRFSSRGGEHANCGGLLVYEGLDFLPGEIRQWELSEDQGRIDGEDFSLKVSVAAGELGQLWELRCDRSATLSFTPVLAREADWRDHPAYWTLGLTAERAGRSLLLHRLRRGDQRGCWLCLASDVPADFRFDPAAPRVHCALEAGAVRLALCLGDSREEALNAARRVLTGGEPGNMPGAAAQHLGLSAAGIGEAMALLEALDLPLCGAAPQKALWPYGISGDDPLLCCDGRALEALPLLRHFLLLKSCGVDTDLVYFTDEAGEYHRPLQDRIGRELGALGLDALIGSRGGVHFAPRAAEAVITSRAAYAVGRPLREAHPLTIPTLSRPREAAAVPEFSWEGDSFVFSGALPSRAWQLVLSNGRLGCIVTECGPAAFWLENAREQPLTDPVTDLHAVTGPEALWAELEGERISLFAANDGLRCRVRYRPGAAVWEKELGGRTVTTTLFLVHGCHARVILIEGATGLHLRYALQPTLAKDASSLTCRFDSGLFRAEDPEAYLPGTELLAACSVFCGGETAFTPPALRLGFVGEEATVLVCGCCGEEALRALCSADAARAALEETLHRWRDLLAGAKRRTGDAAIDRLLYPWAAYQALTCRLWGRSSLYQRGGAYGFRDQLQDAVNLLSLDSSYARERILDACRHQYVEGDVMHWWHPHPDGDRGVRTRCSDDLLWLCWALCEYVDFSGDTALCEEELPYISSPPLAAEERDRYERPQVSDAGASVLFHARAALDCCIARGFGAHGLPFFGSGDWNDGLDAVDGESVWLGFFFSHCAGRFADLLDRLEKPGSQRYRDCSARLLRAAEASFNGRWYRRGYWADGEPLGGDERIDALPQAWAALCGAKHAGEALDAALSRLVDEEHGLVKLFDPPFTASERYPGYLAGYGAGFRENGGQYTHGALWLALALLERGRTAEGRRLLTLLLPEHHDPARYGAEPFVLAADVCSAPGREGEAGWTWYTGSAGWFLRAAEKVLNSL